MEDELIFAAIQRAKEYTSTNPPAAEIILKQVLRIAPEHMVALQVLGLVKYHAGQYVESLEIFQRLGELDPNEASIDNNLSLCFSGLGHYEEAIEYGKRAIEKEPQGYLFWNNLAVQYRHINDTSRAISVMERALAIKETAPMLVNLGGIYGQCKQLEKSVEYFRRALELEPNLPAAHVDLAYSNHLLGNWEEAFREYEWRFELFPQLKYYRQAYDQQKKWDGEASLEGKRIILYGEQGLGDLIQFVRYAKYIKAKGAHVIIHCAGSLRSLISRCEGVDEVFVRNIVINQGEDFPTYDYHCSVLSLPYLLKMTEFSGAPYIKPLNKLAIKSIYPNAFNVGIVWGGNPAHPHDSSRSVPLRHFRNISEIQGVNLFSLQVDTRSRAYTSHKTPIDLTEGAEGMKLVHMGDMIQSFEDTANILAGLDLLISVDTATLHLAGALGVPTWALIAYNPDWRWKAEGETTVWYDSVRLFRQEQPKQWEPVFEKIREDLNARLQK